MLNNVWVVRDERGEVVGASARDVYSAFQDLLAPISPMRERDKYLRVLEACEDALREKPIRHGYTVAIECLATPSGGG